MLLTRPRPTPVQNVDFPKMSNDMVPESGTCTVVGLWTRAIERVESCGEYCTRSICEDDYVAEFAWVGGPTNDASEGMGYSTTKVDLSEVDMIPSSRNMIASSELSLRVNTQCNGGCDRYGGWLLNATVTDRSSFTSVALSQGWRVERCRYCTPCGDGDPTDDNDHGSDYTPADPWGFPEHPVSEAVGIVVGDEVSCRVPAEGVANVPGSYDCPPTAWNSLCARLADLPKIELSQSKAGAQKLVIAGAICLSIGGCPWMVLFGFLVINWSKSRAEKKTRVKVFVRQTSAKNMMRVVREISGGNSTAAPPTVTTVDGVVLSASHNQSGNQAGGMPTTTGVVVTGTPAWHPGEEAQAGAW